MSIQSEINRIINYRDLSFAAVRDKGVDVPSDAVIEDLPDYIALISSGGGGMTVIETEDEHGGTVVTITGETVTLQAKNATPTKSTQTILPDEGYTGLSQVRVNPIPSEYIIPSGTKSITANGTGIDVAAYAAVNVSVPSGSSVLQTKSVTPTESIQVVSADPGYDGLDEVDVAAISSTYVGSEITRRDSTDLTSSGPTVSVPSGYYSTNVSKDISSGSVGTPVATKGTVSNHSVSITPSVTSTSGYITGGTSNGTAVSVSASELVSGTKSITENGTNIDVTNYSSVNVSVSAPAPQTQVLSVTPTETDQVITPDTGYYLSEVDVGAISSTYVGSGISRRSSTDLTSSGATVTVPAGYYEDSATKTIASGSATAPASISGSSAAISTGTNTITLSKTVSVTPAVTSGFISSGTAGNSSVSLTATVTTKGAATITPTKSSQTISSGTYLTGTQTIAAIPAAYQDVTGVTASASDVVSGKTIVSNTGAVVNGSLVIQHYYTGSSVPTSSQGEDGDIYLVVN